MPDPAFPPTGPLGLRFPAFIGTMRDYDRLLSIPFASLVARCPVPYVSLSSLADLRGISCQRQEHLESAGGPLLPAICARETDGSPKFPSYPF